MRKLLVKYSLLCLTVLCFSVFSEDTTSTTDSSTSQTTGDSADTSSTTDSSTESTTTDTTSDTTTGTSTTSSSSSSSSGNDVDAGKITVTFANLSGLELTQTSSTLEGSCWGSGAPVTVPANGKITFSTLPNCAKDKSNGKLVYEAASGESFTLSLEGVGSNNRAIAAAASSDQYNLKSVENVDRDDDEVEINYFLTPLSTPVDFSIIVGSDPQAWRQDNSADPNNNQGPWEAYMRNVIKGIKTQTSNKSFMIINGDTTEYGRDTQRESYHSMFSTLPIDFLWGLGNHDYANNVGDCTDWPNLSYNACARESVSAMVTAIDWYKSRFPGFKYNWNPNTGSLAYSWTYGNVLFIQLQNYPTYKVTLDHWANATYYITSSLDYNWLTFQLSDAWIEGKVAVINMHDYSDHFRSETSAIDRDNFRYLLNTWPVLAVFAGHTHQAGVFNRNGGDSFFGRVPVFNSGALFKGDFMAVDFAGSCLTAWALNGKNGSSNIVTRYGQLCMSDIEKNSRSDLTIAPTEEELKAKADEIKVQAAEEESALAKSVQADADNPRSFQIATKGENSLCLAAVAGANATLADCSKPETFFNLEERSNGYNKLVSVADTSLCLKTNATDDSITLGACKGDNSTDDLTSTRLWLLPNSLDRYLFRNKYKDQCVQATGETDKVAQIADCASENDDSLASQEWVLKRDNIELQPAEESGQ
ncbi:metallophosphoesterase [Salmonella enterica]